MVFLSSNRRNSIGQRTIPLQSRSTAGLCSANRASLVLIDDARRRTPASFYALVKLPDFLYFSVKECSRFSLAPVKSIPGFALQFTILWPARKPQAFLLLPLSMVVKVCSPSSYIFIGLLPHT